MEAIILAGGLGTRLRPLVHDVPKPMAPISGRPFLEYQMAYWERQGVKRFILSVGYLHQKIESHFGKKFESADIEYSVEEEPLGTGGGLLLASRKLETLSECLVLNGDTFFNIDLDSFRRFHFKNQAEMTMGVLQRESENRYGSVRVHTSGAIESFRGEEKQRKVCINGGVYLFQKRLLMESISKASITCSLERDLFPLWHRDGRRLFAFPAHGSFLDIGLPDDYMKAEKLLNSQSMISWRRKDAS